ncbi:MAG TPA: PQQ-binding-like beta-propeller repeat protein [Chlamydiales bacterium]|nr:PQQ-binding-like beta-propeller repeat protein [Chlamydiales bacterium]
MKFKYHVLSFCFVTISCFANSWNQFRGNDLNNGFIPIQTSPAEKPAWTMDVGPINGTSPAVGPDGTIFVGNTRGTLTAINPDGTRRWRKELSRGWRCSSPSISTSGDIFVACTFQGYVTDHRGKEPKRRYVQQSKLFCCNPNGGIRWTYTPPTVSLGNHQTSHFFFTSNPKVYDENGSPYIFIVESYWDDYLMQRNFLIVLDESGQLIDARFLSEAAFAEITGGGFKRAPSGEIGPVPLPSTAYKPENAIAIVKFENNSRLPAIIVSDQADAITAFQWENNRLSSLLWSRGPSNANFDYFQTSPAVHYGGLAMLGRSDGRVFLLDPWSGEELSKPWPKLSSGIYSTPTSLLRQIYLITLDGELTAIDSDGSIWKKTKLGAQSMSSVAMSASFLYVQASDGIYTLSFDAQQIAHFEFSDGGNSSPAIGNNGAVYALGSSTLFAFD